MTGIRTLYWDSCVFLAYIKGETEFPNEMLRLDEARQNFDAGTIQIVTSAITVAEILEAAITTEQHAKFRALYARPNFAFLDASHAICKLAGDIRSYYKLNPAVASRPTKIPLLPDAIHVASAIAAQTIHSDPIALWTFDNSDPRGVPMTALSGKVMGKHDLEITLPK